MSNPSERGSDGWSATRFSDDEGWGPSTAVQGGSRRGERPRGADRRPAEPPAAARSGPDNSGRGASGTRFLDEPVAAPVRDEDDWSPAGPPSRSQQQAVRRSERAAERDAGRAAAAGNRAQSAQALRQERAAQRGVRWWLALLVLVVIAALGGIIDTLASIGVSGGFNVGIVAASVIAILIVKRSDMFPIVIAPPIVYSAAAFIRLYVKSSGLDDRRVVIDAASNYLVYGFPAIAAATAAVLIIAGIRLVARK